MSEARDLYIAAFRDAFFTSGNETAFERLGRAADLWRKEGQEFSAGIAMSAAVRAAWGRPERMIEAQKVSLKDFQAALVTNPPASSVALASLHKLRRELGQTLGLFETDTRAVKSQIRRLGDELGQRLVMHFGDSQYAENYLVKGIRLSTDLDGRWSVDYPADEVNYNIESFGSEITFGVPSAFHLFVAEEDWHGAHEIVQARPNDFSSYGLRGWKAVVLANTDRAKAVEWFDQAADAFAEDKPPSTEALLASGGSWSGINEQLWAKYFRARARVHEALRSPAQVKELIEVATQSLRGTESGWHSGKVSRFRILLSVLAKLVSDPASINAEEARREYSLEIRLSAEDEFDDYAIAFITDAAEAFRGLRTDPRSELTRNRLAVALEALGRVPLIGPEIAEAVRPAIGESALRALFGPVRTWMHRTLESISSESQLQGILLRLLQAGLPLYAQVRHGPIEYGKDLVALLEQDGQAILNFYQVKCGDIDKRKWREAKDELEEMFLVDIPSLHLPVEPTRTVGVLVCNGHANQHVEPVMDAWLREQREKHGRDIEFRHLDRLVDWIVDNRLVNELKIALSERGVPIAEAG